MPKPGKRAESARKRLERIREALAHELLDRVDPEVQAAATEEARRRMAAARADDEARRRDPEFIARVREASLEHGGGSAARYLAHQHDRWVREAQLPVTLIAPGLITATVNKLHPEFAAVEESLARLGAKAPFEVVPPAHLEPKQRGESLPWKEVARRLDIPKYPANKWRALKARCRRQPLGSMLRALLTDRSAGAVEAARQEAKVIAG